MQIFHIKYSIKCIKIESYWRIFEIHEMNEKILSKMPFPAASRLKLLRLIKQIQWWIEKVTFLSLWGGGLPSIAEVIFIKISNISKWQYTEKWFPASSMYLIFEYILTFETIWKCSLPESVGVVWNGEYARSRIFTKRYHKEP